MSAFINTERARFGAEPICEALEEGLASFAFVLDCFSRMVVGWQLAAHMCTDLVLDALRMALGLRGPGADEPAGRSTRASTTRRRSTTTACWPRSARSGMPWTTRSRSRSSIRYRIRTANGSRRCLRGPQKRLQRAVCTPSPPRRPETTPITPRRRRPRPPPIPSAGRRIAPRDGGGEHHRQGATTLTTTRTETNQNGPRRTRSGSRR